MFSLVLLKNDLELGSLPSSSNFPTRLTQLMRASKGAHVASAAFPTLELGSHAVRFASRT